MQGNSPEPVSRAEGLVAGATGNELLRQTLEIRIPIFDILYYQPISLV